ncbi:hypothetical protein QAD02_017101 [Eretmocerus hayati]|uniref:Uncharacterized protein n=1 Tax=Eretmocerus hayati TaxID=131215 RepID=A0ACC2PDD7_9HYME|nr:hypothetical protein QAD02_017101 [Eretmocerus hayati]
MSRYRTDKMADLADGLLREQIAPTLPGSAKAYGIDAEPAVDLDKQIDEVQKQIDLRSAELTQLAARAHAHSFHGLGSQQPTRGVTRRPAAECWLPWWLTPLDVSENPHRARKPQPRILHGSEAQAPSTVWDPPTTEKDDPSLGQRLEAIARRIIVRNKRRPASGCSSGHGSLEDLPVTDTTPTEASRPALTPANIRPNLFGRVADPPLSDVDAANTDKGCCLDDCVATGRCSTPAPCERTDFSQPEGLANSETLPLFCSCQEADCVTAPSTTRLSWRTRPIHSAYRAPLTSPVRRQAHDACDSTVHKPIFLHLSYVDTTDVLL